MQPGIFHHNCTISIDTKMKITFVSANLDLSGGSRIVAKYAEELSNRGHDVTVIEYKKQESWLASCLASIRRMLKKAVERVSDSQEIHFSNANFSVVRLKGKGMLPPEKVPNGDAVIATWWETAEWVSALPPSKGLGFYFIQHHEVFEYLPIDRVKATYRLPLEMIVISGWLLEVMRNIYGQKNVRLIHNAVDHLIFTAPPRARNSTPTVGFIYSPTPFKGSVQLLEALVRLRYRHPELRCISFGDVEPHLHGHPLPSFIEFTLRPEQLLIPKLYAQADVWLIGSESEGFCLPALEAMACGTPVISTRTGWPAEGITDGENGYLYDHGNNAMLDRKLEDFLALSMDAWSNMSRSAQESARMLTWESSSQQFEQALGEARQRRP